MKKPTPRSRATSKRPSRAAPPQRPSTRAAAPPANDKAPTWLAQNNPAYKKLVARYAGRPLDQLMNLQDVLAEVRALADFALSIPVRDARAFLTFRMDTITAALENIERVHRVQTKAESVDALVNAKLAALLSPMIVGFQRILQQYVPEQYWRAALNDLREVAALPVAQQVIETTALPA